MERSHLRPYTKRADLVLTSLEHVEWMLPRASVDKTESLTQTCPSAWQKESRRREKGMLSEQSSISHVEIVSLHSAENQFF